MTRPLLLAALLAGCTPMPDRMDCTGPLRDGCTVSRDDAQPAAEQPPETPDDPGTEPEERDQNPGNGRDAGHAPFDGERGQEPSGKEKK